MYRHCQIWRCVSFTLLEHTTKSKIWVWDSELHWQLLSHFIAHCRTLTMVYVSNIRFCFSCEVTQFGIDIFVAQESKMWGAMFTSFNSENNLSTTGVCITHSFQQIYDKYSKLYRQDLMRCIHLAHTGIAFTGLILGLRPANQRRRYKVTPSLIGWAQT